MDKVTTEEFAELCRSRGPEVLQLFVEIMREGGNPAMARIKAGEAILRYGFDKLLNYVLGATKDLELDGLSPEQRIELFKQAIAQEERAIAEELGQIA